MVELSYNNNAWITYNRTAPRKYIVTNKHFAKTAFVVKDLKNEAIIVEWLEINANYTFELPEDGIYDVAIVIENFPEQMPPAGIPATSVVHRGFLIEIGELIAGWRKMKEGLYCGEQDEEQVGQYPCYLVSEKETYTMPLSQKRGIMNQVNGILFLLYLAVFRAVNGNEAYEVDEDKFINHKAKVIALWKQVNLFLSPKVTNY